MNTYTINPTGYQIANELNKQGLLTDGITVEKARELILPFIANPMFVNLSKESVWEDFLYSCEDDFNVNPGR